MSEHITTIKPKKSISIEDAKELWGYKELLYFFTWRDIKVRYKQTSLGIGWAIIQPFITMVVFSMFFGKLINVPSDNVPYPIFVYVGLLFWQFFSGSLNDTSGVLLANQSIITKVYFPRLILPLAAVVTKLVDFLVAGIILAGMMIFYGFIPHQLSLLVVPLLLIITFMLSVGGGLFLASINVKYRDIKYVIPFFIQLLLYVTPVIYPASLAGKYSWILAINPMTGVIQAARAVLLGTTPLNWITLMSSFGISLIIMLIGIFYFKKVERYSVDIL